MGQSIRGIKDTIKIAVDAWLHQRRGFILDGSGVSVGMPLTLMTLPLMRPFASIGSKKLRTIPLPLHPEFVAADHFDVGETLLDDVDGNGLNALVEDVDEPAWLGEEAAIQVSVPSFFLSSCRKIKKPFAYQNKNVMLKCRLNEVELAPPISAIG